MAQPESFLGCLNHFLTPAVWRQVLRRWPRRALRWRPQPLLLVLLVMTWCAGDSQAERFETARAFYVASYQRKRRPGRSFEGFQQALARVPARALRRVAAAVRARLHQVFAACWLVDGFVPLGCDGSTLACPRSPQLERRLRADTVGDGRPPTVWVTAFVHLSLGLLWSWRLGGAHASEQRHLAHLLATLPRRALVVTDAGYTGYELLTVQRYASQRKADQGVTASSNLFVRSHEQQVSFWWFRETWAPESIFDFIPLGCSAVLLAVRGIRCCCFSRHFSGILGSRVPRF